MEPNEKIAILLEHLIHVIGRTAIPIEQVRNVVGTSPKYLKAFNFCDGSRTQREIAKKLKLDKGNLSRAFARWVKNGIAFWLDDKPIHVYPIHDLPKKRGRSQKKKSHKKQ